MYDHSSSTSNLRSGVTGILCDVSSVDSDLGTKVVVFAPFGFVVERIVLDVTLLL